jgi:uncharacterized protein (UPF0548 family)
MFLLKKPTEDEIRSFISSQSDQKFSYHETGASRNGAPTGFVVDHNHIRLGEGEKTFNHAQSAIRRWEMFNLGWVQLFWPDTPIEIGSTVGVLAHHFGLWSLNACRIVYLIDEDGPVRRYGFAYGTLAEHAESGEERFMVEWRRDDDSVWYDLFAFSRPNQLLSIAGFPVARFLQKRFAKDSKQAMIRAVTKAQG